MSILVGLALITVLTIATGYFVAQEFAYVAADRGRLQAMANAGDPAARRALRVCERLSFTLSGAQLGITVTALLVGYAAEPFLGRGLAELLGATGVGEPVSRSVSVLIALVFATGVQMVLGELAPKNWAIANPETLAKALSRTTAIYLALAGPVIRVFDAAANRLLRRVGIEPIEELPQGATAEDLEHIVADATAAGGLDQDVAGLLRRGLAFRGLTAEQAMTPRIRLTTLAAQASVADAVRLMTSGYSRFPVVGQSADDVLGVVGASEIMRVRAEHREQTTVATIVTEPVVVPASLKVPRVLERLRAAHRQLACVTDEYGGFAGVISLEDIAEELVGEIHDEDDPIRPMVRRQPDGPWILPAMLRIDEVRESTGISLPDDDAYETVSGLILQRLGRIAGVGDVVTVDLTAETERPMTVTLQVRAVARHVPALVALTTQQWTVADE